MRESLRFLRPYLARHRRAMAIGFGALVMKDTFSAMLPLVIRQGVDSLAVGVTWRSVAVFAAVLIGLSAVKGFFQYWMRWTLIGVSRDIELDLRNDLFERLTLLDRRFYLKYPTGDILARATNDLNAVRMMAGPGLMYWCETMLTFLLAFCVMMAVDWPLTLAALAPAPIISFLVVYFGSRIHARFEEIQELFSRISSRVQESVSGARVLRAYGQGEAEVKAFSALNQDYIDRNLELVRTTGIFEPLLHAMIGITFLIVLWMGSTRLLAGRISLGSFVMFQTYMGMLIWPMIAMGWVINLMQRGTASLGRIREILATVPAIAPPANPRSLEEPRGEIEFRGVTLRYASGTAALRNVSLHIREGEIVGIAGHTGSGKTTLIDLIPRLADPGEGQVLFDGYDVREYDPAELRRAIAVVPQETFLFSMTLRENIALGVPDASLASIEEAVRVAGLEPDLEEFPLGIETVIGERGITLSGGQRQRTAIARAVLRDPRVLILDDALSSVDTITEERILTQLSRIMHGRTTLLISHRVSTLRNADRILVLLQGEVAEQGTHEQLLAKGGYYADLFRKQKVEEELEAS